MLKPFTSLPGSKLYAVKEKWYRSSRLLQDGTDTYGKLSYSGFFGKNALAEIDGWSWNIEETGFWKRRIIITDDRQIKIAEFKKNWGGHSGVLILSNGNELTFTTDSFWSLTRTWSDPQRGEVMKVSSKAFRIRSIEITLLDSVKSNPMLPMLALLGTYLIESARRQHTAAGAG